MGLVLQHELLYLLRNSSTLENAQECFTAFIRRSQVLDCSSVHIIAYYRKIHYLTREFRVKLHAKTDIARIAKR